MRLINADKLNMCEDRCPRKSGAAAHCCAMCIYLCKEPTVKAEPVVHSKWIGFPNGGVWDLKCDACHRIIPTGQTPETMHYCPQCGAKMDS